MSLSAHDIAAAVGSPPPTPQQAAVIEAPLEPALVVAGAGSGKTETMAARVVWLVTNGLVRPEEVLGLTFTRKASIELAERIGGRLRAVREAGLWQADDDGDALALPTVSTYHAYAGRLVTEHGLRIGIEPESRLLSEAASWQLAGEVVRTYDGDMDEVGLAVSTVTEALLSVSGELAEHLVEPDRAEEFLRGLAERVTALGGQDHKKPLKVGADTARDLRNMARVYPLVREYRELKRSLRALDFADQMAAAARLARDVPAVGVLERQRYRAVLLDEFQDTSEAQMVLLESLFAGHPLPVTAVGDPHQSIYGWRGASATTLTRFPDRFRTPAGPAPVLALSTSWRNAGAVLLAANRTARPLRAASRVPVEQLTPRPDAPAGRIEAARLVTHELEATHVADWVQRRWSTPAGGRTGASAAVLCRNRAQFDGIVHALRDRGLPVEVVGLGGLLSAPEVADLVALLTVAQDPGRGDQLMRLLTGPVCRLGAADLDALWEWARALHRQAGAPESEPALLSEALHTPPSETWAGPGGRRLSPAAVARLTALGRVLDRLRALVGIPLPDLLVEAERLLGLDIEVAADPDQPAAWARAQLDALVEVSAGFAASAERPTLGGFIDWLEAARDRERGLEPAEVSVSSEAVQVLTVHAAKGLEWDVVAVPGLAEAVFPSHTGRARVEDGAWLVPEPKDRGWLTGIGALPYPLRGDADGLPAMPWAGLADTTHLRDALEEHRIAGGRHQLTEERRLAYVAFTRARREMLLTAPVWSTGSTPRVTSRFLEELIADPDCPVQVTRWDAMPDPADPSAAVNPLLEEETWAGWPVTADARRAEARDLVQAVLDSRTGAGGPPPDAPVDDPREADLDRQLRLLLAERAQARADRGAVPPAAPGHLSTSALVELSADPDGYWRRQRRPVPTPPAVQARAGTEFHSWVEQHFAAATLVDLDDLPGTADETSTEDQVRLREQFLASPWAARTPHAVEVAVETIVGGIPVRGRIDAVFVGDDGRHTIVDWKTGTQGDDAARRRRAVQLATYRVAYSRLTGVPIERVDAAFFFAATGVTETPDLIGEKELEMLVGELLGPGGHDRSAGGS